MPPTDGDRDYELHYVLRCPCGTSLTADTEDEMVETAFGHLRERHPDLADHYDRDDILVMTVRLVK